MFECLIEPKFQVPLKAISTQIQTFASQASSLDGKLELSAMLNLQKYQLTHTHRVKTQPHIGKSIHEERIVNVLRAI